MDELGERRGTSRGLQDRMFDWGASLVGFADLQGVVFPPLSRWPAAVSIASSLDSTVMAGVRDGPTPEYYKEYRRVNQLLNEIAEKGTEFIRSLGYEADPFPATIVDSSLGNEYERTLSVAFQHKTAATRAGLGWIGKSALLITPQYGPRLRLATLFTDMPLDTETPITAGRCGACKACLTACPAGAIKGREWRVGLAREALVDVFACRATAKQLLLERVGAEDSVCGVCLSVCPMGKS